jgi:hypothetical protein
MKDFYVNKIGLEFVSEEKGRHVFLRAGKSMLLILILIIPKMKKLASSLLTEQ